MRIASGADAKTIQPLMGHASIAVTYDTYGQPFAGHEAEARRRLGGYLDMLDGAPRLRVVGEQQAGAGTRSAVRHTGVFVPACLGRGTGSVAISVSILS